MQHKCMYSERHLRRLVYNERLFLERGIHIDLPQQQNNSNHNNNSNQCNNETYDRLYNSQYTHKAKSTQYTGKCKISESFTLNICNTSNLS